MRSLVGALVALMLGAARVEAQPAYGSAVAGQTAGATTVSTASLTATGSSNRYLACGIATADSDFTDPTVTLVTFAGVNMNFRDSAEYISGGGLGARIEVWDLALEAAGVGAGAASVITASLSESAAAAIGCVIYTGVSQTTPTGTLNQTGNRTGGSTVTVTSASSQVVIDFVGVNMQFGTLKTATVGSGQTQAVQQVSSFASYPPAVLVSREAGAGSVVMDWTWDDADNYSWGAVGVPLLPVTASPDFIIEAEDYNTGGEGVAYHDTSTGNLGGSTYRTDDVDLSANGAASNGILVEQIFAGEWLKYDHTVLTTGSYTLGFLVSVDATGATFHLEMDGTDITGALAIPNTGGYFSFTSVTHTATLTAGAHTFRLYMDTNSAAGYVGNMDAWSATYIPTTGGGGAKMILLGVGGQP